MQENHSTDVWMKQKKVMLMYSSFQPSMRVCIECLFSVRTNIWTQAHSARAWNCRVSESSKTVATYCQTMLDEKAAITSKRLNGLWQIW